ncbi:MAG: SRPBCC family protein [Burkholderiales bacterium]
MKFAHLVQINDPFNPLIDPLTREQVWGGLKLRALDPQRFSANIDAARLVEQGPDWVRRELRFGSLVVHDTVRFFAPDRLCVEVEPELAVARSRMITTIEAPYPGQLFVRFEYETGVPPGSAPAGEFYEGFVKQAYVAADVDAVRLIRRLAAQSEL